ncbi:MAG TPA: hypothetical protein VD767_12065 [Thermomicrobiales bacterium]|nr:hypothetical protein [Thermomicrobiales bacterium]
MEALIPVVALVAVGLLALRFGADSRPTVRSAEHRLAATGMTWDVETRPASISAKAVAPVARADPVISHLAWTPVPPANPASPYPTLRALDRARDPGESPFATDPDAAFLEQRARHLIDQHWSERVWLTGFVDCARFERLCGTLERERQDRQKARRLIA